jgi:mono/diheme cytochrome c family protein
MLARRALAAAVATALWVGTAFATRAAAADNQVANATNSASVVLGKRLYAAYCAGCHGRYLQGQPLWQLADTFAGRRAPAFDETGFVWQHSDAEIFRITKFGRLGPGTASAMPAFEDKLDDNQVLATISFIKARWPIGLRILQAMHNPGFSGMPDDANNATWQLPPNCNAVLRRSVERAQPNLAAGKRKE